jgi:hypothetical protein
MALEMLLVEPHPVLRSGIRASVRAIARLDDCADFSTARTRLFTAPCDWLVSNVRLGPFNGLHLVHLVATSRLPIRSVVYGEAQDASLGREAQRAGAFFLYRDHLLKGLPALLTGSLPKRDRRNPELTDRRTTFRGGRRCVDSVPTGSAPSQT